MDLFGFAISYAVIWWLVLFMVLPFGVQVPEERPKVEYQAAPQGVSVRRKLLLTTLLAFIPTIMLQSAIHFGWLDGVL